MNKKTIGEWFAEKTAPLWGWWLMFKVANDLERRRHEQKPRNVPPRKRRTNAKKQTKEN